MSSPVQQVAPIYTDFRQKHVTVQGLRPGDTLEFSVATVTHTALASGQFWTEYDFQQHGIVLDERLEIDVPLDRAVTIKNRPGFEPLVKEANGRRLYSWKHSQLEPASKAKDADKDNDKGAEQPRPPAVRLTTFQTWEQVGEWYAALESPQRVPTPEIRKKAAELTAGRTTDLARLEALYEFVAAGFRYVSLSLRVRLSLPRAGVLVPAEVRRGRSGIPEAARDQPARSVRSFESRRLYLERRQYDKALPQFEKAVTLAPENARLHVQLGKAQLNLKREPEAMAAFDKAIELSPTPGMWNDIGYELSLSGVQLDRALRYAESAVSSATAASRNLDVARADASALSVVSSLAAYWDTLGWVHVARGDLHRALPYVEASWRLGQHAEVGDHLAQIQEKLGRREDAMRTYAQALTAERPSDQIRERLARLAGPGANVDQLIEKERESLWKARTMTVPVSGASKGTAEFVVLLASASAVESVRFVSGDEALRPLGSALEKVSTGRVFPDDVVARIMRRGVLTCSAPNACSFTLVSTDDARPVQ